MGIQAPYNRLQYPGTRSGIDPTHPAFGAMVPNNGVSAVCTGTPNLVSLLNGVPLTINGVPTFKLHGTIGPCARYAGASQSSSLSGQSTAVVSGFTLGAIVNIETDNANSANMIISVHPSAGVPSLYMGAAALLELYVGSGHSEGLAVPLNSPCFIGYSSSPGQEVAAITNLTTGAVQFHVAGTQGSFTPSSTIMFGNWSIDGNDYLDGSMAAAMYSPTGIGTAQMLKWASDPWSFWYPRRPLLVYRKVAVAAVTPFLVPPVGILCGGF